MPKENLKLFHDILLLKCDGCTRNRSRQYTKMMQPLTASTVCITFEKKLMVKVSRKRMYGVIFFKAESTEVLRSRNLVHKIHATSVTAASAPAPAPDLIAKYINREIYFHGASLRCCKL
jgi:hypothetical protein